MKNIRVNGINAQIAQAFRKTMVRGGREGHGRAREGKKQGESAKTIRFLLLQQSPPAVHFHSAPTFVQGRPGAIPAKTGASAGPSTTHSVAIVPTLLMRDQPVHRVSQRGYGLGTGVLGPIIGKLLSKRSTVDIRTRTDYSMSHGVQNPDWSSSLFRSTKFAWLSHFSGGNPKPNPSS